jgi:signal recognition particle subunit SRP54
MGFFDSISQRLQAVFRTLSGKKVITEQNVRDMLEEVKTALLEADVNVRVVRRFTNRVLESALGMAVIKSVNPGDQFVKILYDNLVTLLGDTKQELQLHGPDVISVILMVGLQGHGKTTTTAKLGLHLQNQGRRVLLVAADRARPAAIDQLEILGKSIGVEVFRGEGNDPVAVVDAAIKFAKKEQHNLVLVDTAGRLQIDHDLMNQLVKLKEKFKPVETILVADAMTGQSAVSIAQEFEKTLGITGIILTKFDSDTRGGAALSLKSITEKPIKFIGVGEKPTALEVFHPERLASRILGMGDVVSLVEKAQEIYDAQEAERIRKKMASSTFNLQDYLDQIRQVRKMGNLQSLVEMMPGVNAGALNLDQNEKQIKQEEAIILSMTVKERQNHLILGPSRRQRIARGSGTNVFMVNQLIKRFEKMRDTMRKMAKNKGMQQQMMSQMGLNHPHGR